MTARPPAPAPSDHPSWAEHARGLYNAGNIGAAIEIVETRVKSHPGDIAAWRNFVRWLTEAWQFARADAALGQALATFGNDAVLLALQIFVKQELGQSDIGRTVAANAALFHPDRLSFQFDSRLLLPMVYADKADLDVRREQYANGLGELETMLPVMQQDPARVFTLERSNFLLAYQGEDDLPLQRRYANICNVSNTASSPNTASA